MVAYRLALSEQALSEWNVRVPRRRRAPAYVERPRPMAGATVLLATRGGPEADGAVRIAACAEDALGARPAVFTARPDGADQQQGALIARTVRDVRRQLSEHAEGRRAWPLEVAAGPVPVAIADAARRRGASLVLTGLRHHSDADRLFREENVVQLLRRTSVPVLAVAPTSVGLPRVALLAIDFSAASLHAAAVACTLLAPNAEVVLAHVRPTVGGIAGVGPSIAARYERGVESALERLGRTLPLPPGGRFEVAQLEGDPAERLLERAMRIGADVVSVGVSTRPAPGGVAVGPVASTLLRSGACSVLAAPIGMDR